MVRARQQAGPAERIGAKVLRLDRRLRLVIGVYSAQRIVVHDASYDDVAFPDRSPFVHGQTSDAFRCESSRGRPECACTNTG
jgi:hypothetical protein